VQIMADATLFPLADLQDFSFQSFALGHLPCQGTGPLLHSPFQFLLERPQTCREQTTRRFISLLPRYIIIKSRAIKSLLGGAEFICRAIAYAKELRKKRRKARFILLSSVHVLAPAHSFADKFSHATEIQFFLDSRIVGLHRF
jgi:hypothetical protein